MIRATSVFSQLLQHFPRTVFDRLVARHEAEKHSKGFPCWSQFVAMLFCHLARAESLREICNGLASCLGKLSHLGILTGAPKRSTLSYANGHRPAELFEDLFYTALVRFRSQGVLGAPKAKFRFRNKLMSLDSTTISLCLTLFPWAEFRRTKGGMKVHVLLDHGDYMPSFVHITKARRHDRAVADRLRLLPGSIVAMDRAYNDYDLFGRWCDDGVYFVTRLKAGTRYTVVETAPPPRNSSILSDEYLYLISQKGRRLCPYLLRRVVVWDAENEREIELLTNHLEFGATTIAAIYKDRWEIELFFKTLKQNLRVKTFVGTTENALRIQIWTALIALLLIKYLHFLSKARWSMSNMAALLRMNLFTYRSLRDWLDNPFGRPPETTIWEQLLLPLPGLGQPMRS